MTCENVSWPGTLDVPRVHRRTVAYPVHLSSAGDPPPNRAADCAGPRAVQPARTRVPRRGTPVAEFVFSAVGRRGGVALGAPGTGHVGTAVDVWRATRRSRSTARSGPGSGTTASLVSSEQDRLTVLFDEVGYKTLSLAGGNHRRIRHGRLRAALGRNHTRLHLESHPGRSDQRVRKLHRADLRDRHGLHHGRAAQTTRTTRSPHRRAGGTASLLR